jgi:uncharacterized protein (DUF1697 family)
MSRYIAFLRAINDGGGRTIKMKSLRQPFESLGFSKVATFMASGNVVFEMTIRTVKSLEKKIKKKLQEALGYEVAVFIRADAELAKIANYKPFSRAKIDAATEFNIIFLANTLDKKITQKKVRALQTETDEFRIHGREIYWLRRRKPGRSTFSTVPLEKTLGRPFTIRAAKTVKKMTLKYSSTKS